MKILLFTDALGAGGAQRQLVGLAVFLSKAGYDVSLVTYHDGDFYNEALVKEKINHVVLAKTENYLKRIVLVIQYFKQYCPNVVIAYQASPSIIACLAKLMGCRYRLIVSERNTTQKYTMRECLRFFLYKWADHIIPNSFSQADFILQHASRLKGKIKVITNFVDTDLFLPSLKKNVSGVLRVLTIGRMTPQKNTLKYIESIKILVDKGYQLHVDWYGYADQGGGYYQQCKDKLALYKLQEIFEFHQPYCNVVELYQQADVFCLPSVYEGTPNVICEAMSCGLPILCGDVCDNSKIVKDGVNGILFNPKSPEYIVEAFIKYYNTSEEEREIMGRESRNMALDYFSKEKFVYKYIDIIENDNQRGVK